MGGAAVESGHRDHRESPPRVAANSLMPGSGIEDEKALNHVPFMSVPNGT